MWDRRGEWHVHNLAATATMVVVEDVQNWLGGHSKRVVGSRA